MNYLPQLVGLDWLQQYPVGLSLRGEDRLFQRMRQDEYQAAQVRKPEFRSRLRQLTRVAPEIEHHDIHFTCPNLA